jgi:hypothetical protein
MLTYHRTSRSLHFPFRAVCSLSGSQPEIWSVSWKPPVHRIMIAFRLFVASLQSTSFVVSPAEGEGPGAPGSSGPVHSGYPAPTANTTFNGHDSRTSGTLVLSRWPQNTFGPGVGPSLPRGSLVSLKNKELSPHPDTLIIKRCKVHKQTESIQ